MENFVLQFTIPQPARFIINTHLPLKMCSRLVVASVWPHH